MARRPALALALVLTFVGCTGRGEERAASEASFRAAVEGPCERVEDAGAALEAASGPAQARELAARFVAEQQRLVSSLGGLAPPPSLADPFARYQEALAEIVRLNEERAAAVDRPERLARDLEAAEAGVRALEAKHEATLPSPCPPASDDNVYLFLFAARANAACYERGNEFEARVGRIQGPTRTRAQTARAAELFQELAASIASDVRGALPEDLQHPTVLRFVEMHEARAEALRRLADAFLENDRAAYERAVRDERRAALAAERLAATIGLDECVGLLGISAT